MPFSKPSPQQEAWPAPWERSPVSVASWLGLKSLEIAEGSCCSVEAPLGGAGRIGIEGLVPSVFILCSKGFHWAPGQGRWGFL